MTLRHSRKPQKQPPAEVRAAISRLQEVYAQGHEILAACPPGKWRHIAEQARLRGIYVETVRDMRKLAQRYTPKQIQALCQECERHGRALGPSFLFSFMLIEDLAERRQFQKRAIREGWSLSQVDLELRRGKRKGTGRKHRMPTTAKGACAWLERNAASWLRWLNGLEEGSQTEDQVTMADLPEDLRRDLRKLRNVLGSVATRATVYLT